MFWGQQDSPELSLRDIFCVRTWCKTFFGPIDATFASGLICILVHARLLLVLLAALYWPDKHAHLKSLKPLLYSLFLFSLCILPLFLFWVSCSFFPLSPFQAGPLVYSPDPTSFLGSSPLSVSPLCLILMFIECSYRSWVKLAK